jgi:hypothetical protein
MRSIFVWKVTFVLLEQVRYFLRTFAPWVITARQTALNHWLVKLVRIKMKSHKFTANHALLALIACEMHPLQLIALLVTIACRIMPFQYRVQPVHSKVLKNRVVVMYVPQGFIVKKAPLPRLYVRQVHIVQVVHSIRMNFFVQMVLTAQFWVSPLLLTVQLAHLDTFVVRED